MNIADIKAAFLESAAPETSYKPDEWRGGLQGHCACAAYTLQNLIGGHIVQTRVNGVPHYWNVCGDVEWDLTSEQFGGDGLHPIDTIRGKGKVVPPRSTTNRRFLRFNARVVEKLLRKGLLQ
jgi:hypothetical protein